MVPFLHVTGHTPDEPYPDLLREKGGTGFPYVVFLDGEGTVVAVQSPSRLSVASFAETAHAVDEYFRQCRRAGAGEGGAAAECFLARLALVPLPVARALEERAGLGAFTEAQEERFRVLLLGLEVREATNVSLSRARELGREWAAPARQGVFPADDESFQLYCLYILEHAEVAGDAALFARILEAMRERFGQLPGFEAGFWRPYQERLLRLRERPPP